MLRTLLIRKLLIVTFLFTLYVTVAVAQTVPSNSDPVLQGSATYSMPQSAIDAEIDGPVTMAIRVDETGKPATAALVSLPMWPCGANPMAALDELSSTLSSTMMKLVFTPGIKDGKPTTKDVGLKLTLKNPKLLPKPAEIDPLTGQKKPTQISAGVMNGKAKELPKPNYPAEARANGESGAVTIQIFTDENGKVVRAGALQGAPRLQYAARDAACKAKFEPIILSGNPIKVSGLLTYNFVR